MFQCSTLKFKTVKESWIVPKLNVWKKKLLKYVDIRNIWAAKDAEKERFLSIEK